MTRSKGVKRTLRPWVYLLPTAAVLIPLLAYPLYMLGLLSLFDYRQEQVSGGEPTTFLGLGNYTRLLSDGRFWEVLVQTVGFAAALVAGTLFVGAALAIVMDRAAPWARTALALAALAAWAAPAMTGSTVWMFLFDADLGLVNQVLGIDGYNWFYDRWVTFGVVGATVVWHSFPFVMVTLYAGMRAIPDEVLEAASLDGASPVRAFRLIVLPMLRPLVTIVVIQSIIWNFKIFTQIYIMTAGGGIAGQNTVLNVYAFQTAFGSSEYGLGAAIGVVMTLILLVVTLVYIRALYRSGEKL
ncbi:sugar ABC transporter permease [Nonomuraea longicatena]|uniref:Sugar ABC transporter permease n=1 Tax=Nonomuraea longicatena TaxID=83682 RepID=A0ABN1R2Y5_9ACTN